MEIDLLNLIEASCQRLKQTFQDLHQLCQKQLKKSQLQSQTQSHNFLQPIPQLKAKNKTLSRKASFQEERAFEHFWQTFQQMDEIKNKDENSKEKKEWKKMVRNQIWKNLSQSQKQLYYEYEKQLKVIEEVQVSDQIIIQDEKGRKKGRQRNSGRKKKKESRKRKDKAYAYEKKGERRSQGKSQKIGQQLIEQKQNLKKNSNHTYQEERDEKGDDEWDEDVDQYLDF